jgi:hypothetical protein
MPIFFGAGTIKPIIVIRESDANNRVQAVYDSGAYFIEKIVAGVLTRLPGSSGAVSFASNDVMGFEGNGDKLIVRHNGTNVFQVTETFNQTATRVGGGQKAAGTSRFASWSADSVTLLAPSATQLGMIRQPSTPLQSGTPHSRQPIVAVQDGSGNTMTSDTSTVTASLVAVTGVGVATGTLAKAAVAGLATFTDLGVNASVMGRFKWHFTDGALTAVDSAEFVVQATPVTAEQVLVGDLGGDAEVGYFYDARTNVALVGAAAQTWDDVRGTSGFAPQIVMGVASGAKPLYDAVNKTIEFNQAGSQNWGTTAVDAKFDPSTAKTMVVIGTFESGQDFVAVMQSANHSKYAGIRAGLNSSTGLQDIELSSSVVGAVAAGAVGTVRQLVRASWWGAPESVVGNASAAVQVAGRVPRVSRLLSAFGWRQLAARIGRHDSERDDPEVHAHRHPRDHRYQPRRHRGRVGYHLRVRDRRARGRR